MYASNYCEKHTSAMKQPKWCKEDSCREIARDECEGFCSACYERHHAKQVKRMGEPVLAKRPPTGYTMQQNVCSTQSCSNPVTSPNANNLCSTCYHRWTTSSAVARCKTKGCSFAGLNVYEGYCVDCNDAVKRARGRESDFVIPFTYEKSDGTMTTFGDSKGRSTMPARSAYNTTYNSSFGNNLHDICTRCGNYIPTYLANERLCSNCYLYPGSASKGRTNGYGAYSSNL